MKTIARCLSIDQALLLRSLLEGNGFRAWVPDELTAQTDPVLFLGTLNSIRVQVEDEDAEDACRVLAEAGHAHALEQPDLASQPSPGDTGS